ncbi:MAG: hypothetical protein WCJ26_14160 [bacterium]
MKSKNVDLKKIADSLRERCPFILFAMFTGLDENGELNRKENPELSVFIGPDTGNWHALEQILPVMSKMIPGEMCDVTLLNRVDAVTRFRAANGQCLFVQEGKEQQYTKFVKHASLDYRIMRAQYRRRGIIEND